MAEEPKTRSNWQRPIAGAQRPGATKTVAVYGNSREPAYQRRSEAKPVTFTCIVCGREVTEFRYVGFKPKYCGENCRGQAVEKREQERVRKQREKRQKAREARAKAPNQSV